MSKMFTGVPNAGQRGVAINDQLQAQSTSASQVGITTAGIHYQLGCSMTGEASVAWNRYIQDIYGSLDGFSNFKLPFTKNQLATYLNCCFWADVALMEAARDFKMLNFEDNLVIDPHVDYFGPGYKTVIEPNLSNKIDWAIKYNAAIRDHAAHWPHPRFPMLDTMCYLAGNVFLDDKSNRANYIYFHVMNRSLHGSEPAVDQALTAYDLLKASYEHPDGTNLTQDFVGDYTTITEMMKKVYGDASFFKLPILNKEDVITPIYDAELNSALTNAFSAPFFFTPDAYTIANAWNVDYTATTLLNNNTSAFGPTLGYRVEATFSADSGANTMNTVAMADYLNNGLRLYTGVNFSGERLCSDLFFSQSFNIDYAMGKLVVTPRSRSGITIAHTWYNSASYHGGAETKWCCNSVCVLTNTKTSHYDLPTEVTEGLRAYAQCNIGRVNLISLITKVTSGMMNFSDGQQCVLGTLIDEMATYGNIETLLLPTVDSFYVAGVSLYKPETRVKSANEQAPIRDSDASRTNRRDPDFVRNSKGKSSDARRK